MTKLEIIEDVASYYNLQNRATQLNSYKYLTSDGKKCAVGRYMKNPNEDIYGTAFSLDRSTEGGIDTFLIDEVKGHGIGFWSKIQYLHDNDDYWDETGITKKGKERVEELIKEYS